MRKLLKICSLLASLVCIIPGYSQKPKSMVFEEAKIEGKLRRPQLVLIKADQRPSFEPMAMQSLGSPENTMTTIDMTLFDRSAYTAPFKMADGKTIDYRQ
jgi:hypothetical protein